MMRATFLLLCLVLFAAPVVAGELKPLTPRTAPPLLLKDLDGKRHDLADYRGKVVLVNFWATWCPPCRAEMPSMQRLKTMMRDQPFAILAVDMAETEKEIRDFLKEFKDAPLDFTILLDPKGEAMKAWKVHVFPTSFLVDTEGKLRYGVAGSMEWDEVDPIAKIQSLLPAPVAPAAPVTAQ
ncbi:TlpA disulfide reductase family protein [Thiobacter aerophilum]|uniref:TlpA disulfide reductase family protein n=1 Tax=Thiobacter aerophilum TaxID=3121275 RepID=A0ABV0EC59_9BURK